MVMVKFTFMVQDHGHVQGYGQVQDHGHGPAKNHDQVKVIVPAQASDMSWS